MTVDCTVGGPSPALSIRGIKYKTVEIICLAKLFYVTAFGFVGVFFSSFDSKIAITLRYVTCLSFLLQPS